MPVQVGVLLALVANGSFDIADGAGAGKLESVKFDKLLNEFIRLISICINLEMENENELFWISTF